MIVARYVNVMKFNLAHVSSVIISYITANKNISQWDKRIAKKNNVLSLSPHSVDAAQDKKLQNWPALNIFKVQFLTMTMTVSMLIDDDALVNCTFGWHQKLEMTIRAEAS